MKRFFFAVFLVACFGTAAGQAANKNVALVKAASIEGVTEYRLANGLRVLTLPDPGIDTITGHITYLVGSRHEGYGDKGMGPLPPAMLLQGTKPLPHGHSQLTQPRPP